jgi:hypothetical protein
VYRLPFFGQVTTQPSGGEAVSTADWCLNIALSDAGDGGSCIIGLESHHLTIIFSKDFLGNHDSTTDSDSMLMQLKIKFMLGGQILQIAERQLYLACETIHPMISSFGH